MTNATRRLNQRQMKKKNLGPFQEIGFEVEARFRAPASDEQRDALINEFLHDAIDTRGLEFGGAALDKFSGFVVSAQRYGKTTEEDRTAIGAWLEQHPLLEQAKTGPLRDVWYGWDGK